MRRFFAANNTYRAVRCFMIHVSCARFAFETLLSSPASLRHRLKGRAHGVACSARDDVSPHGKTRTDPPGVCGSVRDSDMSSYSALLIPTLLKIVDTSARLW